MRAVVIPFHKSSYTLQELSDTGNISLFSNEEKKAIVALKNLQDKYDFLEKEIMNICVNSYEQLSKHSDVLYEENFTTKEHKEFRGWRYNIEATQYRLLNNHLSDILNTYKFKDEKMYPELRKATLDLKILLAQN